MRVNRSFAFIDLCGFTAFIDVNGDERAVEVLREFRSCVRDVSSNHGVRVAKWLGDGAMFVSVDQTELVAAVLEIEQHFDAIRAPLALRAGISHGAVILFEGDDHIGSAVNLAARLCDIAAPHEILATPDVDALPEDAVAEETNPVKVPGFAKKIEVRRLHRRGHWAPAAATA